MKITYLGHSAFEIETQKGKILIDPFLVMKSDYNPQGVCDIFVTHAHSDHLGNAVEISKSTGARITAIFELANYCAAKGAAANGIGIGAWNEYPWGRAIAVPAFHSSSLSNGGYGGSPCGFVFDIENTIIYHAGDTGLSTEMKMIGQLYRPDVAMLPIGGHFTMDIEHAATAAKWLETSVIIPMHYNTFDAIRVDIHEFERQIHEIGKVPLIMKVGQTINTAEL